MITKPLLFLKFKLRISNIMKQRKKSLNSEGEDFEEYVDVSWKYTDKQPRTAHENFSKALSTLPWYDVMDAWMAGVDLNPCDNSQCDCSCDQNDDSHYACVESNNTLIESY